MTRARRSGPCVCQRTSAANPAAAPSAASGEVPGGEATKEVEGRNGHPIRCLLYTSDAADDM
eukprot:6384031-Alexandrium_andersonii.AAC.1